MRVVAPKLADPADAPGAAPAAVTREVALRAHEGRPARVMITTRTLDASPDELWDALTSPERISRWFLPISGDLRAGGRYAIEGNASGSILYCAPAEALSITWEFGGDRSWVTLQLEAESAGRTRLRLEHITHMNEPMWLQYGPAAVGLGWDLTLRGLSRHLARVPPRSAAEAEGWLSSAEGRAFVLHCAEGWRDAAIAVGVDPRVAAEGAARTASIYGVE